MKEPDPNYWADTIGIWIAVLFLAVLIVVPFFRGY